MIVQFFITLCIFNFRKQLQSATATVELLKRTEEKLIIKRSEDDQTPVQLTVNKRVRSVQLGAILNAL